MSAADPILKAEKLSLFIRQEAQLLKIVDNVDFSIGRGEFFGLVGESGSGKTMIARAIMRMMPPARLKITGSLSLAGIDIVSASKGEMRRLRGKTVSMIFQEPMTSLNPIMTVEQQIQEALRVHQTLNAAARKERIHKLLSDVMFADPSKVSGLYPHELSGGMRQRVMIAIALANDPLLLIADEPTTALDVTIQQDVMEILGRLQRSHSLAVLFISHDLALVNRYADHIGVLYGGVLMEHGPCASVIARPAHPYTSGLLSCMPRARIAGARQRGIDGVVPRVDDWFDGCRFAPRCDRKTPECTVANVVSVLRDEQSVKCLHPLP
jgi:oligopeptide/dipeptide ABC transporter ATP-binding protein